MITLNEKHHGFIVLEFYQAFIQQDAEERGEAVFRKAAQLYGEERGRRMSLRALRDGNPLDLISYFAYSEWAPTSDFYDLTIAPRFGVADEQVFRCPWADVFREGGCPECGTIYCQEIDRAILRGFQPCLELEVTQTQHGTDRCQFYFRGKEVTEDLFRQTELRLRCAKDSVTLPFHYHCGHVWAVFCRVAWAVYENRELERRVRLKFEKRFGLEAARILDAYRQVDFNRLSSEEEVGQILDGEDFNRLPCQFSGDAELLEKLKQ